MKYILASAMMAGALSLTMVPTQTMAANVGVNVNAGGNANNANAANANATTDATQRGSGTVTKHHKMPSMCLTMNKHTKKYKKMCM